MGSVAINKIVADDIFYNLLSLMPFSRASFFAASLKISLLFFMKQNSSASTSEKQSLLAIRAQYNISTADLYYW